MIAAAVAGIDITAARRAVVGNPAVDFFRNLRLVGLLLGNKFLILSVLLI